MQRRLPACHFLSVDMRRFAKRRVKFSSGQANLPNSTQAKPYEYFPQTLFETGFVPASVSDAGTPIVAQWFNALFRSITYHCGSAGRDRAIPPISDGRDKSETGGVVGMLALIQGNQASIYIGSSDQGAWVRVAGTATGPSLVTNSGSNATSTADRECDWFMISSSKNGN